MGFFDKFVGAKDEEDLDSFDEPMPRTGKETQTPAVPVSGKAKKQFVLFKPETSSNEGLFEIADHLLNHESIILNLELIAKDSRHFIDFLSGVAYAMQGQTKRIAVNTFLITPGGIEVSGDIPEGVSDPDFRF